MNSCSRNRSFHSIRTKSHPSSVKAFSRRRSWKSTSSVGWKSKYLALPSNSSATFSSFQAKSRRCLPTRARDLNLRLGRPDLQPEDQLPRKRFAWRFGAAVGGRQHPTEGPDTAPPVQANLPSPAGTDRSAPRRSAWSITMRDLPVVQHHGAVHGRPLQRGACAGRPAQLRRCRRKHAYGTARPCRGAHSTGAPAAEYGLCHPRSRDRGGAGVQRTCGCRRRRRSTSCVFRAHARRSVAGSGRGQTVRSKRWRGDSSRSAAGQGHLNPARP